jgi:tetratricopeptide (TPR) repeat protein
LTRLGGRLSKLGRHEDALVCLQEAVAVLGQLAIDEPQVYLVDLAGALAVLGALLAELGRREEALTPTRQAIDLYRDLVDHHPTSSCPSWPPP